MTSALVIIGGCIFVLMGCVHGFVCVVDVFRPAQFAPMDDSVRLAMKATRVRFLRAPANMWDAWLGFNLSHSLGMFLVGASAVWLGWSVEHVEAAKSALLVPAAIGVVYLFLSVRFWFYAPTAAFATATACFIAGWWSY